jgi:serine protease AprX
VRIYKRRMMRALLIQVVALVSGLPLFGASKKLAADIPTTGNVNVIIRYASPPVAANHASVTAKGGSLKQNLNSVNSAAYSVPAAALESLVLDPQVVYISPDRKVAGRLEYANPTVHADVAFNSGYDGTGIGIAVIDSGVSAHPDLISARGGSRVVYSRNFVSGASGNDDYGHGTHVAGILAGDGSNSTKPNDTRAFRGMAQNASIISLKVLDAKGSGSDSLVIAAIEQAVALKAVYNIRVMNLSVGRPVYESYRQDPLCLAVEYAWKNGIVVVVAAGNEGRDNFSRNNGYGTVGSPGNDPLVITVGAMNDESTVDRSDDRIASYSSKGPTGIDHIVKPDLVAPGNRIVSLATPSSVLYSGAASAGLTIPASYYGPGMGTSTSCFRLTRISHTE